MEELTQESKDIIEANSKAFLQKCVRDYKILIDTCSLLEKERCDLFMKNLIPMLRSNGAKLNVNVKVIKELQKHSMGGKTEELRKTAEQQLEFLKELSKQGLLVLRGSEREVTAKDDFADNTLLSGLIQMRMECKPLLITQDKALAGDALNLNNQNSVEANKIHVKKINKYGYLSNIEFDTPESAPTHPSNSSAPKPKVDSVQKPIKPVVTVQKKVPENEKFSLCKKVTSIPNTVMAVSHLPVAGETVHTSANRQIRLGELVGEGGEGCVYKVDDRFVAKIYHKDHIKRHTYEKIKRMIDKNLHCEGICFPTEMIFNSSNQFVGYIMPMARGKELEVSVFRDRQILKMFPDGKKIHLVELALNILDKMKYLHDRNILMGDINGRNILLCSEKEVYFVDTDSYQIDDLPCCVGMEEYTPPEFQGIKYEEKLRTPGNENFAIATLLFRMMMIGKLPYAQLSAEDDEKNIITLIKEMDFPYPLGENSTGKAPDGLWRDLWSHFPRFIKKLFYQTFRKDEEHSTEAKRLDVDGWIEAFENYNSLLKSGRLAKNDPMSEDIKPTRGKLHENVANKHCAICNMLIPENQLREGICKECQRKGEVYRCKNCGKEILYSNLDRLRGNKKHPFCEMCFKKKYDTAPAKAYPAPMQIKIVNGQMVQSKRPASRVTVNPTSTRPPAAAQRTTAYRSTTTPTYNRTGYNYSSQMKQQPQRQPQQQPQRQPQQQQNNKPKGRFNKKIAAVIVAIGGYLALKTFGPAIIPLAILAVIVHHIRKDI